ncbi:DUF1566 domain-containing protein [Vibrio sp. AND4]|uniref:DUF1566 domain-containing protein n=1 Tax=Vibrio sp. AND4 TaxID=314289 RepID=UPI00015EFC69|nr:DUF1566 domain-containing protein [Vibrio sp. AND4]EDP60135.1 hypothetical protein AND4_01963 [Vibrio sp. AND4]
MKNYVSAVSLVLLMGCQGESGSESKTPDLSKNVTIQAESLQSKAFVNEERLVTVKARTQGAVPVKLTSVKPLQPGQGCKVSKIQGMTFSAYADDIRECRFETTVEPIDSLRFKGQAKAISRIAVSETASNYALPNISITGDLGQSKIVINLNDELKGRLETSGYTLDENATASDRSWLDLNTSDNLITYTPSASGAVQIMYSMSDGKETKLGTIYLAISDQPNSNPIVDSFDYDKLLKKNTVYSIKLAGHITDNEQAPILKEVIAYDATITNVSQHDYTFDFKSSTPGRHEVAFIVEDKQGGYGVGQVVINVEPEFDILQDWSDITIMDPVSNEDITFTAPLSKEVADYANVDYQHSTMSSPPYGPNTKIVSMDWHQAQKYCSTRNGRLPTSRELEALKNKVKNAFNSDGWPTLLPFWSIIKGNESTAEVLFLNEIPEVRLMDIKNGALVTCVYLDGNVRDFKLTKSERDDDFSDLSKTRRITATLEDPDGNPAVFQDVLFWSHYKQGGFGDDQSDETTVMTDIHGRASVNYEFTSGVDDVVMSRYGDSAAFTAIARSTRDISSVEIQGVDYINVGSDQSSIKEYYELKGVQADGTPTIIDNSLVVWSAQIDPPELAQFNNETAELTTHPQPTNTNGTATITACTTEEICNTKVVTLGNGLINVDNSNLEITEVKWRAKKPPYGACIKSVVGRPIVVGDTIVPTTELNIRNSTSVVGGYCGSTKTYQLNFGRGYTISEVDSSILGSGTYKISCKSHGQGTIRLTKKADSNQTTTVTINCN